SAEILAGRALLGEPGRTPRLPKGFDGTGRTPRTAQTNKAIPGGLTLFPTANYDNMVSFSIQWRIAEKRAHCAERPPGRLQDGASLAIMKPVAPIKGAAPRLDRSGDSS